MSKIVFGPVTSRRFGQSLGIDLSPDQKQCNFDCLYCELKGAKTVSLMQNPPQVTDVIAEVLQALKVHTNIDVITLSANGEPTLYPFLKELVNALNGIKGDAKLLILSNASTIMQKNVQDALLDIDIVKLSLDCASQKCFKKLDRPIKELHVKEIIEGMVAFSQKFSNELVLEVLVVSGINDTKEEFLKLKKAFDMINPHRIDVGTIDRPPAYDVRGVSMETLQDLASILAPLPINIAYKKEYKQIQRDFSEEEILSLIAKRPQSFEDIRINFSQEAKEKLQSLVEKQFLHVKSIAGVDFYKIKEA